MSEEAAGRMGAGGKGGAAAAGCLLAIDFGGTKIAMATATPSGERLGEAEIPTLAAEGAARVLARTREASLALLARTRRDQRGAGDAGALPLLAVAAVTPGIVQPDGIRFAPNNPGWETLALEPALRRMFAVRVVGVATDVKAAALAEARFGALAGVGTGLYVNLGTGLAAAAVIDGRVLRGAHGAAGEIGYQLLGAAGERACAEGGAPLEEHAGGGALAARVSALLGRETSAREAFALAATQPAVAALLDEALDTLARHVANLALMIDPERIVLGGGMARVPALVERLRAAVARAALFEPQWQRAAFGHGAALQGAIVVALDALRESAQEAAQTGAAIVAA
ncbi:ROK family protein [Burkholderia gladioli]|uniref:ROK family protein n=1 Tax=Burkholderia gladioli TaxID=28095 RepID=UPI001ABA80B9|nr:ROK family protein [Burkholderia gladioli]